MRIPDEFLQVDETGAPKVLNRVHRLPEGGVWAAWWSIEQSPKPIELAINHNLGTPFGMMEYWFRDDVNPGTFYRWSGKKPHPDEAGPVQIQSTTNWIHFYFEANKPVFAMFEPSTGGYYLLRKGHLGVLLLPD